MSIWNVFIILICLSKTLRCFLIVNSFVTNIIFVSGNVVDGSVVRSTFKQNSETSVGAVLELNMTYVINSRTNIFI